MFTHRDTAKLTPGRDPTGPSELLAVSSGPYTEFARLIEALVVAMALAAGAFLGGFDSASGRALAFVLLGGVLLTELIVAPPSPGFWGATAPVFLLIIAAIAWLWIGMAVDTTSPVAPDLAIIDLLGVSAGFAALAVGALIGFRRGAILTLIDCWLILVTLSFVVTACQAYHVIDLPFAGDLWRRGRLVGLIGNANVLAAVSGSAVLLGASRLMTYLRIGSSWRGVRPITRQLPYVFVIGVSLAALLATGSRIPAALTFILLALITARGFQAGAPRMRMLLTIGALGIALLQLLARRHDILLDRMEDIDTDSALRAQMLGNFAHAITDSLWFGFGPGSFPTVRAVYLDDPTLARAAWTVNSPHNILLQLLLKGGIPYAACMIGAVVMIARTSLGYFKRARRSIAAWGLATTALLILGIACVDITLDVPVTLMLAASFTGMLWGEALAHQQISSRRSANRDAEPRASEAA